MFNPSNLNIHTEILQTVLFTFPFTENLIKDQIIFLVIIPLIIITSFLGYVSLMLLRKKKLFVDNALLRLKGLNKDDFTVLGAQSVMDHRSRMCIK